jgi:hypothetical protein
MTCIDDLIWIVFIIERRGSQPLPALLIDDNTHCCSYKHRYYCTTPPSPKSNWLTIIHVCIYVYILAQVVVLRLHQRVYIVNTIYIGSGDCLSPTAELNAKWNFAMTVPLFQSSVHTTTGGSRRRLSANVEHHLRRLFFRKRTTF